MTTLTKLVSALCLRVLPVIVLALATIQAQPVRGQDSTNSTPPGPSAPDEPTNIDVLAVRQSDVTDKYRALEQLMLRMSDLDASENPQRAAILRKAFKQSKERLTLTRLNGLVNKLSVDSPKLKPVVDDQKSSLEDMRTLLKALQSENRSQRRKDEETRVREYIKEVERIIRIHRSVQGRTEGGADEKELAEEQKDVANRTGQLAEEIRENEEGGETGSKPSDQNSQGNSPSGGPSNPKDPSEDEGEANKDPNDDEGAPNTDPNNKDEDPQNKDPKDGNPSEQNPQGSKPNGNKPKDGQPQEGQPKESDPNGQNSDSQSQNSQNQSQPQNGQQSPESQSPQNSQQQNQQSNNENPARKRIQAAEQKMRDAQKKLENAERDGAIDDQQKAREELEKAKAQLEEILRQLREEEVEQMLAMLESRFRAMYEQQLKINEETKRLDNSDPERRDQLIHDTVGGLAFSQVKLVEQAERALQLLLEEGSSVAFPETVEQMRDDMSLSSSRLRNFQVGQFTQDVQEDILSALEEMIEALQQAQKDKEEQKKQQQQQQQGQPQDPGLVNQIAELKMIRALQKRVNARTKTYAGFLADADDTKGQATDPDLKAQLSKLSERQQRVLRITREIILGRNK